MGAGLVYIPETNFVSGNIVIVTPFGFHGQYYFSCSGEKLLADNCYPLAPTLPPRGLTAHAMPPYYLHWTCDEKCFHKTEIEAAAGAPPRGRRQESVIGGMGASAPIIFFLRESVFHGKTCAGYYSIAMEPRALGVSSTLAFVEQAVRGCLKIYN